MTKDANISDNKALRGVNLGGWLVLEKWMTPRLFAGSDAVDEYSLVRTAGAAAKIAAHRQTFITESDFQWLQQHRIEAVRIPVGFWAIGHHDPLLNAERQLDWAFQMAKKYDLKVLLCLHGARGSQNGKDHSGRIGPINWFKRRHRHDAAITLGRLLERYSTAPALWGVELLNEPAVSGWWRRLLLRWWTRRTIRQLAKAAPHVHFVYSDAFQPDGWSGVIRHHQAVMDVHHYQTFSTEDRALSIHRHIRKAQNQVVRIRGWQQCQPVIIGEWSLALHDIDAAGIPRRDVERQFGQAQLSSFDESLAWFFWSYKTEAKSAWNFRHLVEDKILEF